MATTGARARGTDRGARRILLAGAAGLFVVRTVLSVRMHGVVAQPDEPGFLGNAWFLGRGHPAPVMAYAPVYKVGYSVVLAPLARLVSRPHQLEVAAIVVNALAVTALVPLLYLVMRRLGPASGRSLALIVVAAAALPGVWVAVPLARPDAFLMLLVVLAALALWAMATPGRWWARVWFGPTVAWLWVSHDRFLPLLVLAAVLLALRAAFPGPDADRRFDGVNLALLVVVAVAGWALNRWVVDVRWVDVIPNSTHGLRIGDIGPILRSLVGQWWYLLCSTYGLAGLGVAALGLEVAEAAGRGRAAWTEARPLSSGFVVLALVSAQVAGAVQLRHPSTFDLATNGRYQDVVVPLLVAVGLSKLLWWVALGDEVRPLVVSAVAVVATGVVVEATTRSHDLLETASISGIGWAVERSPRLPVLGPSFLALLGLGLLAAVARYRPRAMVLLVLVGFSAAGLRETEVLVDRSRRQSPAVDLAASVRQLGVPSVAVDTDHDLLTSSAPVFWQLAGRPAWVLAHAGAGPAAVVLTDRPGRLPGGSRMITLSTDHHESAWAPPGREQRRLASRGLLYPPSGQPVPSADRLVGLRVSSSRVTVSAGSAWVDVRVTNDGIGTTWPSPFAVGQLPVTVTALGDNARHISFAVPELRPRSTAVVRVQLGSLATEGPGRVKVAITVTQGSGQPLFRVQGAVPELELITR